MLYTFLKDNSIQNQALKIIYLYIYKNGPVSRAEITEETDLNRSKVARSLKELLDRGFISIEGQGQSEGGRPPTLYAINPHSSYIIGVYITRFQTKVVLFDLLLRLIDKNVIQTTIKQIPRVVLSDINNTISEFMNKHDFTTNNLLGIGIGAVGPLDKENGRILNPEPFLAQGWDNVPIIQSIKEKFPVLVMLDNGANTAVLGEYKFNRANKNLLNVTVGWSWGCGIILNGELMDVESADVSGYGHMIIDVDGRKCFCGKRGCLIAYTSLNAILNKINETYPQFYQDGMTDFKNEPVDRFVRTLAEKDRYTKAIVLKSAKYLGIGISNLANLFSSELVVVQSPLIDFFPGYYEEVIQNAAKNCLTEVEFKKGEFEGDTAVLGAAVKILDSVFENEY